MLILPGGDSATVRMRRYASGYEQAPSQAVEGPTLVVFARDLSDVPWHAEVSSVGPLRLCGAAAPPALLRGPIRPRKGDQHCVPASLGERECRFSRY
jgi:hypothetical protein